MAKEYVDFTQNEYFNAKVSLDGEDIKLTPKNDRTLDFTGTILINGQEPGSGGEQVQSDWAQTDDTKADFIKNKPSIPDAVSVTQIQSTGTKIATITVGSTDTDIYAPEGGGSTQADWNQNDSSADDFIKNRTHYTYIADNVYEGTENNTITCTKESWGVHFSNNQNLLRYCPLFDGDGSYYAIGVQLYDSNGNLAYDSIDDILEHASEQQISQLLYSKYPLEQGSDYPNINLLRGYNSNNIDYTGIGISTVTEPWRVNNGFQWGFWWQSNDYHYALFDTGTYTIKLRALARDEIVQKLDNKYLSLPPIANGTGLSAIIEGYVSPLQYQEQNVNTATNNYAHAGGYNSHATGDCSFSQGANVTASGDYSASLCYDNTASNAQAVAIGTGNTANGANMLKFGKYSITETPAPAAGVEGTYVEVVGNGTSASARSNARTLDWSGNEMLAGNLTLGGTSGVKLRSNNAALETSSDGGTTWNTVGGGTSGTDYVQPSSVGATIALDSDKFYDLGTITSDLTISFNAAASGKLAQYQGQFTYDGTGSPVPTITFPNTVTWKVAPNYLDGKTYQFSIVNGYGVIIEF